MRISIFLFIFSCLHAETGRNAWLRYEFQDRDPQLPAVVVSLDDSVVGTTAREELIRGIHGMFGRIERAGKSIPKAEGAIVLGTLEELQSAGIRQAPIAGDGYRITVAGNRIVVSAANAPGILYGVFAILRKLEMSEPIVYEDSTPASKIRWVNHWDNMDGTIERGYGGRSLFFDAGHVLPDLTRAAEYARLLASLGINACAINSVNANIKTIDAAFLPELKRVAEVFRPWGVHVALSLDFGSPKTLGGLATFDPADPAVITWWDHKIDEIYQAIPDLAGFVLKADSEGRVGPSAYGRSHADAANVIARPARKHGGLVFYRGFVYDHHADWRNLKNDRARAAYDNLHSLDGKFDDNVVVQIKHGPIDFQVREPASPLFAALPHTNQAIELQITQEYFGQGHHTVFLIPMWKEALDFDMRVGGEKSPVKALATGKFFHRPTGGFVGVSNAGLDDNWFGNHLSQANLYGFGRLAWNPDASSRAIIDEWTRLTFGGNPKVTSTVAAIQLASWRDFENYTGNLGLQTLTEITGSHYGPAVEASERNGWGQWHRSDEHGSGMDRTVATGTGYIGQYPVAAQRVYETLAACPDDLLLFMHHVPYTYKLHSGETVIQHIYDSHYMGADAVARHVKEWRSLKGLVDERRYNEVLSQLEYQAGAAIEWRDSITSWFLRTSGIADAKGRVGHYPGRVEAESMELSGYQERSATPWETASGGKAVECAAEACSASTTFEGAPGWYRVRIRYFDRSDGASSFRFLVAGQLIDEWRADAHFPSRKLDGAASTVRVSPEVALRKGDQLRIEGKPGGKELAPLDYIEIESGR